MKTYRLEDFYKGWFVGNFSPTIIKENFEVGIVKHIAGECHQDHFHKKCIEITAVIDGKISINGQNFGPGDIFVIYPYEVSQVEFLTDVTLVVVRDNSNPLDKFEFQIFNKQ
jgi:hypothetical protein